jgi:hypothetical protein
MQRSRRLSERGGIAALVVKREMPVVCMLYRPGTGMWDKKGRCTSDAPREGGGCKSGSGAREMDAENVKGRAHMGQERAQERRSDRILAFGLGLF